MNSALASCSMRPFGQKIFHPIKMNQIAMMWKLGGM